MGTWIGPKGFRSYAGHGEAGDGASMASSGGRRLQVSLPLIHPQLSGLFLCAPVEGMERLDAGWTWKSRKRRPG